MLSESKGNGEGVPVKFEAVWREWEYIYPLIPNLGIMWRRVESQHSFLEHSAFGLDSQGIVVRFTAGGDLAYFNFHFPEVPALLWYEFLRLKQHRYFVSVLCGLPYAAEETV